jgi:hypothetical protein
LAAVGAVAVVVTIENVIQGQEVVINRNFDASESI